MTIPRMGDTASTPYCQGCYYGLDPQDAAIRQGQEGLVLWHWPCLVAALDVALAKASAFVDRVDKMTTDDAFRIKIDAEAIVAALATVKNGNASL